MASATATNRQFPPPAFEITLNPSVKGFLIKTPPEEMVFEPVIVKIYAALLILEDNPCTLMFVVFLKIIELHNYLVKNVLVVQGCLME